jgi:membrane peptidoglycan carboxypeptidase
MFRGDARRTLPSLSPREWLIRVHYDLLSVHDKVSHWAIYYPDELTTFEKLVLVLEDRRFFEHGGVDLFAVVREAYKLAFATKSGGASTIDMQFVRTATDYRDRTFRRKLYEMFLASIIQFRYSKITILRSYLEAAYFGWGLRGADKASMRLFKTPTANLTVGQAAVVASLLVFPLPRRHSDAWLRKVSRRANYIEAVYMRRKQRFDQIARCEMVEGS